MGRISKIRKLGFEKDVIELHKRGLGSEIISQEINKKYNLEGENKIIFSNVSNYLDSISERDKFLIKQEHIEEVLIEPLRQLKEDLSSLRGPLFEKAKRILTADENGIEKTVLSRDELHSLEAYLRHYEEIWDRIARIENLLKPNETIQAKNVIIIKQFNQIKELINDVVATCDTCKTKFINKLEKIVEVPYADL